MSDTMTMEYQEVKFGEIARQIAKRVDPSETSLDIYVGLEHLDPDSLKITRHGVPSDVKGEKLLVKQGQIIFGKRRAYQRKVAVADWDCICSAHAMVLEAIPGKILPEFLPFFMQSNQFMERAVEISEGSLSPTIKWKVLEKQIFKIPNLSSQESLLQILNSIELNTKLSTDSIIKMDEVKNNLVEISIQKAKSNVKLNEVSNFIGRGISPKYSEVPTNLLVINQKCIRNGKVSTVDTRYQQTGIKLKENAFLVKGDLCINSTGTGTLGRVGIWSDEIKETKILIDSHVTRINIQNKLYEPEILVQVLNSPKFQSKIYEECVTGSTNQIELNKSQLMELEIPNIEIRLQRKLVKAFKAIDVITESLLSKLEKLEKLKKKLLTWSE